MKNYFKIFSLILLLMIVTFMSGCGDKENNSVSKLMIYTINDFHGNLESSDGIGGASKIAGFIKNSIEKNDDASSIILSAGDMFQGTGISNYTKGLSVINVMNEIGFDAMTIGNHEFDWGLDTILDYRDSDQTNGEANFPFLGCNIIQKDTDSLPKNVNPYTIINQDGLKIGVIGYIGLGLESDIATQMVENYEFIEPVECIKNYASILRVDEDCDIVITLGHDGDSATNRKISKLNGNARIDAIINGHTHATYVDEFRRDDGVKIQSIQSGTAGEYVGITTLSLNEDTKEVTSSTAFNQPITSRIEDDEKVSKMVSDIVNETAHIFQRQLCTAGVTFTQNMGCHWAANALQDYMQVDVSFINTGGIRRSAFPIEAGTIVTVANVFEIMPFDNTIKTVKLKGSVVKGLCKNGDLCYGDNITDDYGTYYINGIIIDDNAIYTVACVDYIFDQPKYPFLSGEDIYATGILFRDILIENLEEIGKSGSTWNY